MLFKVPHVEKYSEQSDAKCQGEEVKRLHIFIKCLVETSCLWW